MDRQKLALWRLAATRLQKSCAPFGVGVCSKIVMVFCLLVSGLPVMAQTTAYMVGQTSNTGNGAGTTVSLVVPSSAAVGDLLLAQVSVAGLTACTNITAPTGWTSVVCGLSSGNIVQVVYSKTATSADLSATESWTLSSSHRFAGTMLAYRNALGVDISGAQANGSSGTATAPTVTTTVANDVVVAYFASAYAETISPSSSLNVEAGPALSTGTTTGIGVVAADFVQASAGATGTQTATLASNNARTIGTLVAIKPVTTTQACSPPSNVVATLGPISNGTYTCYCDNFNRTSLSPSPIFNSNWLANYSNGTFGAPRIVAPGRMRMTDNSGNAADSATVPGIFPAAGNYISVEFNHYAYNGTGADGLAVTLSDSAVPANPGGYGGSQGYAPEGTAGFAGGWLGVALDEYGNYSNPTEGRTGGPGFIAEQVGMRGPGSGTNGYRWIAGSGGSPGGLSIDDHTSIAPSTGYMYQVIVDARNETSGTVNVSVNRDASTMNGSSYSSVVSPVNVYTEAANALAQGWTTQIVPNNWLISFTSSTGGSTNIHEIGSLRVCAQTILPPNSGNSSSNFNAIDSHYAEPVSVITAQQGHIYTKLAGVAFPLDVIAFANSGTGTTINTAYVNPVTVQLIDDSTPSNSANSSTASCNANATNCNSCTDPVIASQVVNFTAAQQGQAVTANFTVPNAYSRMLARICQGSTCTGSTTIACSADAFTVRPTSLSVSSTTTNNTGSTGGTVGSGMYLAGTTPFGLNVSTATAHYTGIPQMNAAAMQADNTGWVLGTFSPTAFGAASATGAATGFNSGVTTNFKYSDVGHFSFLAYNPTYNTSSLRGIDDENWTGPVNVTPAPGLLSSNDALNGDCNGSATNLTGAYSNTIDSNGKYGCFFGLVSSNANSSASLSTFGRFVPDHFALISGAITPAVTAPVVPGTVTNFTYMGDPALGIAYTLNACAGSGPGCSSITANYSQSLSYPVSAPVLVAEDGANQGINLAQRISLGVTAPVWASGVYQLSAPNSTFALPTTQPGGLLTTPGILTAGGPFDSLTIGVNMTDANSGNVSVIYGNDMDVTTTGTCSSTCSAKQIGTATSVRQGRLTLANAYGSELLTLPVTVTAQYYDSTKANWLTNTADNAKGSSVAGATTIPAGAAFITNKIATLSGGTVPIVKFVASQGSTASPSDTSPALSLSNGVGAYYLYDTNAAQGSADIAINLGVASPAANDVSCNPVHGSVGGAAASWLQYPWCVATPTKHDPNARLKFGSPKTPYIYLREMY